MKTYSASIQSALEAGTLVIRDFIWIEAKTRDTGIPFEWGAWSGNGAFTCNVKTPQTGAVVSRTFEGGGGLIEISEVPLVSGLTVETVTVSMSQIDEDVENIVRSYTVRRAPIEIYRGFFDPVSMKLVDSAFPRFHGFIDEAPIETPPEGEEGSLIFTCTSFTQELTRRSGAKRSHSDQKRRDPDDHFFRHAASVGTWEIRWGD